jgi:hypothetical protein
MPVPASGYLCHITLSQKLILTGSCIKVLESSNDAIRLIE